ncbi:MAG: MFS transporter [Chloroflexota bacterium]|nr:MFS transporter [Chloroflexota bacterium]
MPGRLTRSKTLLYSAGSIGAGAFFAFNNFVLPQLLKAAGASDLLTGLLASTRSIEGAIIQPAVGALSDRTRTRLGRRRPFIAAGIPLSAAFFLFAATQRDVLGLTIAIVLFSVFFNIAADPYVALLADITTVAERGILQGVSTAIQLASQVAFLLVISRASTDGVPAWTFPLVGALLVSSFAITVAGVHEPALVDHAGARLGLRRYVAELAEHREALRYLAAIFVFMVGFSAVLPYLTLFITVDIGESESVALLLAAGTLLVTAVAAVIFGKVADRIGTKTVLVVGWTLLAVAAFGGIVIHGLPQTIAVVVLAGIGNGAATAAGWPLLAALVPPEKTGVFAGLKAAAESVAIPASVVVAAQLFLPRFSYRGVFVLLAIAILVALVILIRSVRAPAPGSAQPA